MFGRNGWAVKELSDERIDLAPLFELILQHVLSPVGNDQEPFSMLLVTTREYDSYLGRVLTGRVQIRDY